MALALTFVALEIKYKWLILKVVLHFSTKKKKKYMYILTSRTYEYNFLWK